MPSGEPISITYADDEVKVFHKYVEVVLNDFLRENGLESSYRILHHPGGVVGTVPDFVISDLPSGKWAYVIEVKRSPGSVGSIRSWSQARGYVTDNRDVCWLSTSKPYFLVTNIELTIFFCEHSGTPTQYCLLQDGEKHCSKFGNDATKTLLKFKTNILPKIFKQLVDQDETYANNMKAILDSLVGLQSELSNHVLNKKLVKIEHDPQSFGFADAEKYSEKFDSWQTSSLFDSSKNPAQRFAREVARDCLLRIFTYEYSREFFKVIGTHVLRPITHSSRSNLASSIQLSFDDLERVDFKQIIKSRLIDFVPENVDDTVFSILDKFINTLQLKIADAIKESGTVTHFTNMVVGNEDLYPWAEVNGEGKIMTDPDIADLVVHLCFALTPEHPPQSILDPCVGTGNLLNSCYDRIKSDHQEYTHDRILSYLHGCENDMFLGKLGILSLIMRSPKEISSQTSVDITLQDFFEICGSHSKMHDMVIMNPPFLREDNKVSKLQKRQIEEKIEKSFGEQTFTWERGHPNLFFYFVEAATKALKENGICGSFIMSTWLSTQAGVSLKRFFLENFEIKYVVICPNNYFEQRMVAPCIVVGKRSSNPNPDSTVKFVRIFSQIFFLSNYDQLTAQESMLDGDVIVRSMKQKDIRPDDNWEKIVLALPNYYDLLYSSSKFALLGTVFSRVKRGELANEGNGSPFFFPWSNRRARKKIQSIDSIESKFKKFGLEHSKAPDHYILTSGDLAKEQCLAVHKTTSISSHCGLASFLSEFDKVYSKPQRWNIDDMEHDAQIIIPRSSRKVHSIFVNPYWDKREVYLSTNFVGLHGCNISVNGVTPGEIVDFVAGYLNSSFGQTMFEINSQNRVGLRKIEARPMKTTISVPASDLNECVEDVRNVVNKFHRLDYGLTGMEDNQSRFELDLAVANVLWVIEPRFNDFVSSPEDLANKSRDSLRELVRDRRGL